MYTVVDRKHFMEERDYQLLLEGVGQILSSTVRERWQLWWWHSAWKQELKLGVSIVSDKEILWVECLFWGMVENQDLKGGGITF